MRGLASTFGSNCVGTAVAPILEATWAPRARRLLQLMYGKDLSPGQQRQESQVAPAGLLLKSVHRSSSH